MLLSAGHVVTPAAVLSPGWLRVDGDRITEVGAGAPPTPADASFPDSVVVPGFVDAHVHGGGGASYDDGDPESAATVARSHLAHGTTSIMASLVTDSVDGLERSIRSLADLVDDGLLAGIHLEGPWLNPRRPGAHDPQLLTAPRPADVDRLLAAGPVRMATIAPELPGGVDAVGQLAAAGVVAAVGHTDATYDQTRAAIDVGARAATHLFNTMPPLHHREPGPVAALLESEAWIELVADGVHLHPSVLRLAADRAGHRTVLVTDAMAAAAAADGRYRLGRLEVDVQDGVARLADSGAIAGSTLTTAEAFRHAVQTAGLPLVDVVHATSTAPAAMLGLDDVGAVAAGLLADLVVLSADHRVEQVMRRGSWVAR